MNYDASMLVYCLVCGSGVAFFSSLLGLPPRRLGTRPGNLNRRRCYGLAGLFRSGSLRRMA